MGNFIPCKQCIYPGKRVGTHSLCQVLITKQESHFCCEGSRITWRNKEAGFAVSYAVLYSPYIRPNNRCATCHGLQRGNAKRLIRWRSDKQVCRTVIIF